MSTTTPAGATVTEAARHFEVTEKTVRRWIRDGYIRAERLGPRLLRVDLNSAARPLGGVQ